MAEKSVELDSIELAAAIFGNCDQNVKLLENEFHVTAVCRGSLLKFTGEPKDVEAAVHAVDGMVTLMQNHTPLEEQTVRYCISLARGGEEKRLRELNDDFVAVTAKGRPIHPKTLGQKEYLSAIRANSITFGVGPAGTGKTYLAVAAAVAAFRAIEVAPLAYMRGRTLDDAFIILDEAQNTTPEQMKMFLTRMGVGSKVVVTGDVTQVDLPEKTRSGLVDALHILKGIDGIAQVYLTEKDVVRHRLVQQIVKAYERAAQPPKRAPQAKPETANA